MNGVVKIWSPDLVKIWSRGGKNLVTLMILESCLRLLLSKKNDGETALRTMPAPSHKSLKQTKEGKR